MSRIGKIAFWFIYLFSFSSALHAKDISIPNSICKTITEKKMPSAYLFHQGKLWSEKRSIDLGDLQSQQNQNEISSLEESVLILSPANLTVSVSSSDTLTINLSEAHATCAKTRQYKINWMVAPKNLGPGKFDEQFSLNFDGPGINGYPPLATTTFSTSVTGIIHGPGSTINFDKNEAKSFFLGNTPLLSIAIKNVGDRALRITSFSTDIPENSKKIKLKRTNCLRKDVEPSASCVIDLEAHQPLIKSTSVSYGIGYSSNDVGSTSGVIYLDYDDKSGARTYIKRWE
ncbi:MAG TPA: hypothetical protein VJ698_19295 [Noviherbaspirillum sp.]|uniref:hypothetical protein n=1 Tax=Noviherbaspirillum sp. TaxID=1926288 RepID=UPI002B4845B8|nr:hypothetical protein [Noviherbaspirillum sp.]HJV87623.1 hypothetical protein [Noviherbaspirillum sp.]